MKYHYDKKDIRRIVVIIAISLVPLVWTFVNADGFLLPALMYIAIGILSIIGYLNFNRIGPKSYLFGIDKHIIKNSFFGILFGLGFIFIQELNLVGSILVPYIPASLVQETGRFIIVVIGAMVMESAFFLGLLLPFIDEKFKDFGMDIPFLIALLIVSIIFPIFHASFYGQIGATYKSYVSAGIFLFLSGLVTFKTKSLLPAILSHGIVNFYILNQEFHYIIFGVVLPLIT